MLLESCQSWEVPTCSERVGSGDGELPCGKLWTVKEFTFLVCIFSVRLRKATYGLLVVVPSRFSDLTCGISGISWKCKSSLCTRHGKKVLLLKRYCAIVFAFNTVNKKYCMKRPFYQWTKFHDNHITSFDRCSLLHLKAKAVMKQSVTSHKLLDSSYTFRPPIHLLKMHILTRRSRLLSQ